MVLVGGGGFLELIVSHEFYSMHRQTASGQCDPKQLLVSSRGDDDGGDNVDNDNDDDDAATLVVKFHLPK